MIHNIHITNFKLYRNRVSFKELSSINVLTGVNGRGKSTLMQSMLLPSQSLLASVWTNKIVLDGQYAKLGNMGDVKNEKASVSENIVFEFESDLGQLVICGNAESNQAQELVISKVIVDGHTSTVDDSCMLRGFVPISPGADIPELSELLTSVRFIAAERVGPKLNYRPAGDKDAMDCLGEYAPAILYGHKDEPVCEKCLDGLVDIYPGTIPKDTDDNTLNGVLNFWLDKMFDGVSASVDYVSNANVYVLNFKTKGNIKEMKPTNVGFGFSYVLPILVAGLTTKEGGALLIENPEAHLHPKAQSVLGKFLSWIAKYCGVQVFLETHSEHIVNSFRVLVAQSVISASDVNILFFDESIADGVQRIQMNDSAHIDSWPENFFDQEEKDLDILL